MDLELKRDIVTCYERISEHTVTQEETQETIVPDACPDILRIIDVCGQILLNEKRSEEGQAIISGTVLTTVLYHPEGEQGIRRMETRLPFVCRQDINTLHTTGTIHARCSLLGVDARILNPRKILIRAELAINIAAFQKTERIIHCGVESAESNHICQQESAVEHIIMIDVSERTFHFSDTIRLQHTGEASEILACHAYANSMENRLIGNKLVFKGTIDVSILLLDADGVLTQRHESLPFSQVLELADTAETTDCQVFVELMSCSCTPDEDDGTQIHLEMDFAAQAQILSAKQSVLLIDLYSTTNEMDTKQEVFSYCSHCQNTILSQSMRELLETEGLVRSISHTRTHFHPITQHRQGNCLTLRSKCCITVLYQNESQQFMVVQKEVPVQIQVDCPEGTICSNCHITSGEMLAIPAAGGIEFRLSVQFQFLQHSYQKCQVTTGARLGELRTSNLPRPSVVLRLASANESLWDIAKTYGTTTQQILQANDLEEIATVGGKMLLIPSSR